MKKVQEIVEQILEENGLELVEFSLKQNGKRSSVKIFTDTPTGNVTLDQVAKVTALINDSDEFYAELPEDFKLEVSSPGLDYPLKTIKDFSRNINKTIKVKFEPNQEHQTLSGQLISVGENNIVLSGKFGEETISLSMIDHGQIEVKFK
eukprot:Anaeramoba_ignava/c16958_g1_i2.p3 GENE.c16958_g1_i2~~c16958_g1_i2.p3  ORF type:complete len:149 (+),score=21.21 c16958_g1_i2:174-620(+)